MVDKIKAAIDVQNNYIDIDRLWQLACEDVYGFFGKISIRMIGKRRVQALNYYLQGQDCSGRTFLALLKIKTESELGVGLFKKGRGED